MTKRVVEHEIKLEKPLKFILGVLLNAFAQVLDVREASANATQRGVEVLKQISSHLYCIQLFIESK
jgi:hypothetical protein